MNVPLARRDKSQRRDVTINVRTSSYVRNLIDRAATLIGQNRSEFILDSARRRAADVLLDQKLFVLDAAQYDKFLRLLDEPPKPSNELKKLLAAKAPWER
jgi:uncharacterized protein (DUF1778 family)